MPARLLILFAMVAAVPAPVRSADAEKAKPPTMIVRIKSIDGLLADFNFVAKHAGYEEEAKQMAGFVPAFLGDKDGPIDTKRPIGIYGAVSDDVINSAGVILVPIGEEKTFVDFL